MPVRPRQSRIGASEIDDDLAEHLPAFQPREAAFEVGERHFGVDHRQSCPPAILARLSRMLRIEAPNEPKIRYCCWNSCIRLKVMVGPGGRAAGDQPAAALQHQQRAVEAFAADMLEHDIDALLVGELARDRLEPLACGS